MGGKVQKSRYRAMCAQYTIPGFKRRAVEENGLPQWLSSKESTCNAGGTGVMGSVPGSGRSPGEGNGNPLQYFCLENPMDGGAWQAIAHGVAKS